MIDSTFFFGRIEKISGEIKGKASWESSIF
jgi:hypothetical protein